MAAGAAGRKLHSTLSSWVRPCQPLWALAGLGTRRWTDFSISNGALQVEQKMGVDGCLLSRIYFLLRVTDIHTSSIRDAYPRHGVEKLPGEASKTDSQWNVSYCNFPLEVDFL